MRVYILQWSDLSPDISLFVGYQSFEEFIFIIESVKRDIQPGSSFESDKAQVIDRLRSFNIDMISSKTHIAWRFFH